MTWNANNVDQYIESYLDKSIEISKIETDIEKLMRSTRDLYWSVLKIKQSGEIKDTFDTNYLGVIETALEYIILTQKELENSAAYTDKEHTISPNVREGDRTLKKVAAASVVPLEEMKHAWENFLEYSNTKALFALLGTILTLLIGELNTVKWAFVVLTIINFAMRLVANKYKNQSDYIGFQRNIGMFLWSYVLLVIGNTLGGFVSFSGLPDGTFPAFITVLLVWSELRGIVENAKIAQLQVPHFLERIVNLNKKSNDHDLNPPF